MQKEDLQNHYRNLKITNNITKDENKIPILAKAKVLVGSIRMELTGYQNLANPVAKID